MSSSQPGHQYDTLFYQYQREGSLRSARVVLPLILPIRPVKSMLDVGCGAGAWLSVAKSMGLEHVAGVDGDYVDRSMLLIDASHFSPRDISKPFDTGRTYDLVQCLEVAEHVPTAASATLVANIVRHGPLVLFSAAVPGQGGEDHINEQPYGYWRDLFAAHGYRLFDCVRSHVAGKPEVEPWYRYNLMVFAHDSIVASLPADIKNTRIADGAAIPDISPLIYRMRKAVLASLPAALVSKLAVWKHQQAVRTFKQPVP